MRRRLRISLLIICIVFVRLDVAVAQGVGCGKLLVKPAISSPELPLEKLLPENEGLSEKYEKMAKGPDKGGKTNLALSWLSTEECSPEEKVVLWRTFVKAIRTVRPNFESEESRGSDKSWIFRGHLGETLVIAPDGRVYLTHIRRTAKPSLQGWDPPYDLLTDVAKRHGTSRPSLLNKGY